MQFVRELRKSSLLMPLLLTPSIRCQLLSRSRTLLQCKASNLTDSVSEEGLKLNARRLLIQVWSSWYAVNCLSPASQNTHSFCSKLGIIRTFFFFFCLCICNFLQVLCLSSPTHDNNCCFSLQGTLWTGLSEQGHPGRHPLRALFSVPIHVALASSLNNEGAFIYFSISMCPQYRIYSSYTAQKSIITTVFLPP